jgi:hypothetical protein
MADAMSEEVYLLSEVLLSKGRELSAVVAKALDLDPEKDAAAAEAEAIQLVDDMELREHRNGGPIAAVTPLQRQVQEVLDLRWRLIEMERQISASTLRS